MDLEDQYLWYFDYLKTDPRWKRITGRSTEVTFSSDESRSSILLDPHRVAEYNLKQNFVLQTRGEKWVPRAVIIRLEHRSVAVLTKDTLRRLDQLSQILDTPGLSPLWFLKKAGPGMGGGYDVRPLLLLTPDTVDRQVRDLVREMNQDVKYRRDVFVLQEGVQNPLLTEVGQKLDLRLYVLAVGSESGLVAFYACRLGDIRNTLTLYDPRSTDVSVQVTNISQNRKYAEDFSEVSRVFSPSTPWYPDVYSKFLKIVKRFGVIYGPILSASDENGDDRPFFSLIGFDAVIEAESLTPIIVEINRRPTVYPPGEAVEKHYSSAFFMRDVYDLGLMGIVEDRVGFSGYDGASFDLVYVHKAHPGRY